MKLTSPLAALLFSFTTLIAFAAEPAATPAQVDGFSYVKTVGGISEYTLDANGLTVLAMPEHSSPTLTFMVTYRVGSRNEVTGTTGATHLLEHLMFKGSPNFNDAKGNSVKQFLERVGGNYNATTWLDRTNYYANIGSEFLEGYIAIEADRMRNLWLRESDRKPEMTVVRNEFERGENSPFQALIKEIFQAAYVAHPYHHSTIGWRSDIENVPIEKQKEFYDTFYWPDNATVSIIGDFETEKALALVKKYYGVYPRAPHPIPQIYTEEPQQTGARRVLVKRAGQLGVVAIGFKIPPATHADYAALSVLDLILTDGKNSRLFKTITDQDLSTGVQTFVGFNHDPSLHITFIPLAPGAEHAQVEKIAFEEIEKLKKDGVTPDEVKAAVAKFLANASYQRDGSFAIAGNLNECIAVGAWTLYSTLEDAIKNVTPADVQRVAQKYFNVDQSTTGWFIPVAPGGAPAQPPATKPALSDGPYYYRTPGIDYTADGGAARSPRTTSHLAGTGPRPPSAVEPAPADPGTAGSSAKIAPKIVRAKIAGIDVIAYPTGVKDVVTIHGAFPAGDAFAGDGNVAIPTLTGMMLDQGTTKHDKFEIAQMLESVGATVGFGVDTQAVEVSAKCLKKDVPLVIGLIAEQLRSPAFSPEEFEKAKKQFAGGLQRQLENTDFRAADAFNRAVYPVGHPNRNPAPKEFIAAAASAKLDDVKAFYAKHYGPAHFTLVVVGDLDIPQIHAELGQAFAGWTGGVDYIHPAKAGLTDAPKEQTVFMADKTSVSVVMGQSTGLRYRDPDQQALRVATAIFGSGFTGRLMANVRDKEGLTYGIYSRVANDTFADGDWRISATFAPAKLEEGIASARRQLDQWYRSGVTPDELASRKTNLIGTFKVGLATTDGLAANLLTAIERGYDVNWLDQYPDLINGLTLDQVNTAIKKHLKPDSMFIIKAGTVPGVTPPK
jgi:zinc protease